MSHHASRLAERFAAAVADRYQIEREVGHGGMATVFLAHDIERDREVAIKLLNPDVTIELGAERFQLEIATMANLHHPHILALHESGEAEGLLYYVMPYVAGETVRDRIEHERQLPLDDALQITREVADALSYAHSRGVVHRDIKPANILLASGRAMVADFGIMRPVGTAERQRITRSGMTVGTPSYMSPEQAVGELDLDGRSDQYALACVLYEMLAGQPPFVAPNAAVLVRLHLTVEPAAVTTFRSDVPASVAAALHRALSKTPADRFDPITRFIDALDGLPPGTTETMAVVIAAAGVRHARARRLLALAGIVVAVAVALLSWWVRRGR
jgi:serine/threonine-protein kinase